MNLFIHLNFNHFTHYRTARPGGENAQPPRAFFAILNIHRKYLFL
ncbi:hypothetical protein HMPREF0758_3943 [Serratia odorifera DSM 4582]|uniref:Uncharacterized protein n=2 Tax=Serratia odorifera TaxID=618 RepID=D4E6Z3_SEROD|nr:hypothetical protein HMPREF0758_3943 [Serratia odorifera DSM 4582]